MQDPKNPTIYSYLLLGLRFAVALLLGYFLAQLPLHYLESYLYDLRTRMRPTVSTSENVALIIIRPSTVEALRGQPTANQHQQLLEKLRSEPAYAPRAVVYNLILSGVQGSDLDKSSWVLSTEKFEHLYAVTSDLRLKGQESPLQLPEPIEKIRLFSGPHSRDVTNFAKDGVTRRMMVEYQNQLMLHPFLASLYNPEIKDLTKIRGIFPFLGSQQVFIDFRPAGTFKTYLFEDVLSGQVPASAFKDKIIIIGQDLLLEDFEHSMTPYSRLPEGMTSTELHANMFDTLIRNSAPVLAPWWVNLIFICLVSILTVHVVLSMRPVTGLLILLGTFITYVSFSYLLLWLCGWWIALAHPILAIFLAYYFFIPYRLIVENRRSWEYYQRNNLLQQVESLKTNFISMMSHDLKTPIARIQGMVDVIIRESSAMNSLQREAVDTIRASSEDLLKFINSILNYAKIESSEVKLNLQSKDINLILEEVIKKHEFLAKIKQIQIVNELEPLFPVVIDADLMRQVFSNLVENAIKYSPESTKILVSSEERGNSVIVQIADQGPGIPADEITNIFAKFFRSRTVKNSPIKGSGLGLYLAKYFTTLHHGQITVESTEGQGCTFSVEIPQNQP